MARRTSPEPVGRRERNKADKRERILRAARRRFAEQGYDGMTMAQVARDADVAIGTVFQYAATKPELLMMVTADRWRTVVPRVVGEAAEASDARAAARILLSPFVEAERAEHELTRVIARELMFGEPGLHRGEVVGLVAEIEQAIARGLVVNGAETAAAGAAARLVVSGALIEINRTREGRAHEATLDDRLAALLTVAVKGCGAA